jgi:hypothetical protein
MVPCGFDYFKGFDRAKVNMYKIPKLMCIKDKKNLTLRGDFYSEKFKYLEVKLYRCDKKQENITKVKCKSDAEIQEFFRE